MDFQSRTTEIAGSKLAWRELGEGAPLLFLHGAGGADALLPMLAPLARRFRVIVPDHPGYGSSPEPAWLDDIHDVAYAYLEFLRVLDLENVHLAGTSIGGWIGLEVAIRDQSRLASLTVIGACGIRPGDIATGDLFMWSPEERIRNLVVDQELAAKMLAAPSTPEQQEVAIRNHFTTAKLGWEPRFFDRSLEKWLHLVRVPTHVIWGDQDRLFPIEYGKKLHALLPSSRWSVIERCGHVPHAEQPARLRELLETCA